MRTILRPIQWLSVTWRNRILDAPFSWTRREMLSHEECAINIGLQLNLVTMDIGRTLLRSDAFLWIGLSAINVAGCIVFELLRPTLSCCRTNSHIPFC